MEPQELGSKEAGSTLNDLLLSNPTYRRQWEAQAQRRRGPGVNYSAVSKVVALHLWNESIRSDRDRNLPRSLRTRIERALKREQITFETMSWILDAFSFTEEDRSLLWSIFSGGPVSETEGDGIKFTLRNPNPPVLVPQNHRTTALFNRYYIDNGLNLQKIETSHVLTAVADVVERYGHNQPDNLDEMSVVAGGKIAAYRESAPGFVNVEFHLATPLPKGKSTSLQYVATYLPRRQPCTEVRRAARGRTENVDLRVIFSERAPRQAWWAVWDDHTEREPLMEEPLEISENAELHHFIPFIEETVVGFRWNW
ncbi:hypothetical protein AB0J55_44965 [Amycolatopsis sp. NPDC049688]|uniref:hypothetical protein n=1 Tax=Amycolatopsis sp. NPDC049688 TaxID=3154733 RepID=UPI0034306A42